MADSKSKLKWLDRFAVSHKDHVADLEQRAAELEFDEKVPRHEAEDRAYSEYRRDSHFRGAAHHLRGLRAAQASGDREDARKHSAMLELHSKANGFDPYKELPAELHQYMHADEPEAVHKFKAHRTDSLVLDDHRKSVEKAETDLQLGRILRKAELVSLFKSDVRKPRMYRCTGCNHESLQTTNHTDSFHDKCPKCSWKGVGHEGPGPRRHEYVGEQGPTHAVEGGGKSTPAKTGHLSVAKSESLSKGAVIPFPKGRSTSAVDRGQPASVAARIEPDQVTRYHPAGSGVIPTPTPRKAGEKLTGAQLNQGYKTAPLYKPGHRVKASGGGKDFSGTVHSVHPSNRPNEGHIYHVNFDDGHSASMWEDQLDPHK